MEAQPLYLHASRGRACQQAMHFLGHAAEFLRQIAARVGASEAHAQQQRDPIAEPCQLVDLGGVVGDERGHPRAQRGDDVARSLDRMGVNGLARADTGLAQQFDFALAGNVEVGTFLGQGRDGGDFRQRLDRVVQPDAGQGRGQRAVLLPEHIAVEHEQR